MNAVKLLYELEARGVRVREQEGAVVIAPANLVSAAELKALRTLKPLVLAYLRGRALGTGWARVSLWQLDRVLEIAVPWVDVPIILAPGCRIADNLRARESLPGRVWCVCEVLDLLLSGITPEDARRVGDTKMVFGGTCQSVRP